MIKLDISGIEEFAETLSLDKAREAFDAASRLSMHGWMSLPDDMTEDSLSEIAAAGEKIAVESDALVVLGAGGSSLGARALVEAMPHKNDGDGVREVLFAGDNLSGDYMARLIDSLECKDFSVLVTSKSGTTTEPAAALRVFLRQLRLRYGGEAMDRLYVIAGDGQSKLRSFAMEQKLRLFGIPENVGGRYSVLTASGLLPAAARGLDIRSIIEGAKTERESNLETALSYAAARQALGDKGFRTEIFATFEPPMGSLGDWWRQLFGESEGKDKRGIFPATVRYSGDLHSMGQYVQDGPRDLFETILTFGTTPGKVRIPENSDFDDGFDFLTGMPLSEVNDIAAAAVKAAHIAGGVPVLSVHAPKPDERSLGALLYFFECACAASGMMSGVNPFDQPGVEAYKKIMLEELRGKKHETRRSTAKSARRR